MTEQREPSKSELLDALRSGERVILDKLSALPADTFEQGRYENGWNGRQILAHIASIEWTYPRLIDIAREGTSPGASRTPTEARATGGGRPDVPPTRSFRGGNLSYNERQVEKRAQMSVADLVAEFQKNRAATIAAVEQAEESLLAVPIRSAGGITGPLARVIYLVAVLHVAGHLNDIVGR